MEIINPIKERGHQNIVSPRLALLSYIPFIGWIFPLYHKKSNSFCLDHAKQGFLLAVIFIAVILFFSFINIFTPVEFRFFRFGVVISIYFFYTLYFFLCIVGALSAIMGKSPGMPLIKKLRGVLD